MKAKEIGEKEFPVLDRPVGCAKSVRIEALNEEHAWKNHRQSLKELKRRGGLSPVEIFLNVHKLGIGNFYDIVEEEAINLTNSIAFES